MAPRAEGRAPPAELQASPRRASQRQRVNEREGARLHATRSTSFRGAAAPAPPIGAAHLSPRGGRADLLTASE
eukprot:scaffold6036_cov371-Prasinococcus_capsulatus_cf.AAC.2